MDIKFTMVGCACFIIDIDGKFKFGCDPALAPKGTEYDSGLIVRTTEPVYDNSTFNDIDFWILTHAHFDHLDEKGAEKIKDKSMVISSKECHKLLDARKSLKVDYLEWLEKKSFNIKNYKIEVEAVRALHGTTAAMQKSMSTVNGYVISIFDGKETKKVYITGDTIYSKKVISRPKDISIDLLIANMGEAKLGMKGDPITLSILMLKKFIKHLKPSAVVSVHVDDFSHFTISRTALELISNVPKNGETISI